MKQINQGWKLFWHVYCEDDEKFLDVVEYGKEGKTSKENDFNLIYDAT